MSRSIGFIGLGAMGTGMALNLLRAGFELHIWNRSASKMDTLLEEGAIPAANPTELANSSEISIVCVSDTPDVESVVLGHDGIIHGVQPGSLVIDTSTISPKATRNISARLRESDV
ncbi:MAG: NAD(P)-binding domain-containing protein, partial [Chloroflexota bacterium]|nr:NAD(P)-binding domain-containing protein [Chloroflexota bacterium]